MQSKKRYNTVKPRLWFGQKISLLLCGIFFCLILLELSLRLGGFVFLSWQDYKNKISLQQEGGYRILCLGDSMTALGGQNSYPRQLEEILNQNKEEVNFSVINKGIPRVNSSYILDNLERNLNKYKPEIVVIMTGINDRGIKYESVSYSQTNILDRIEPFLRKLRIYRLARMAGKHFIADRKNKTLSKIKIPLRNKSYGEYIELGNFYDRGYKFIKAEQAFKKAIEINPENYLAYHKLGQNYYEQGKYGQAEAAYKKAIEINPKNEWMYIELGRIYRSQQKYCQAQKLFEEALKINPRSNEAYVELFFIYHKYGKYKKSEDALKKAIETGHENKEAYYELNLLFHTQDYSLLSFSAEVFEEIIKIDTENDWAYRVLSTLYMKMGKTELAKKYANIADRLKGKYYNPITIKNYLKMKEILDKRGITYVFMQYPMRNVNLLKSIFQDDGEGIIFVDNEKVFRKALRKANYKSYFKDYFAGDFGHCTDKGNKLIAKNIAETIIKELFSEANKK